MLAKCITSTFGYTLSLLPADCCRCGHCKVRSTRQHSWPCCTHLQLTSAATRVLNVLVLHTGQAARPTSLVYVHTLTSCTAEKTIFPSQKLAPEWEAAAKQLQGGDTPIALAKVDCTTDGNKALAERFGIKGFPTIKVRRLGSPKRLMMLCSRCFLHDWFHRCASCDLPHQKHVPHQAYSEHHRLRCWEFS
jgi:Thioredoxin